MNKDFKEITQCRCCGNSDLKEVLNLGDQPLANSYIKSPTDVLDKYPLRLMLCIECEHLQLSVVINPDLLFKNYLYVSGTTETLRKYFDFFAYYTIERYKKYNDFRSAPKRVLDIACNDGTCLDSFKKMGLSTYGIDPAENLMSISTGKGHTISCAYFDDNSFKGQTFDIITAQNVFAHTDDAFGFLMNCRRTLAPNGVLFIQTSQANMVENNEFDTIYHEHLSFFSESSMKRLANRAGFILKQTEKFSIHGVSFIFELVIDDNFRNDTIKYYENYRDTIIKNKELLINNILDHKKVGYKIVGYGAAAKGMTLLGFTGIKPDYIIDDNPLKAGMFTPINGIPIVSVDILKEDNADKILFIPLAWNFFDEIKTRIKKVRDNKNDLFIKYFPEVVII